MQNRNIIEVSSVGGRKKFVFEEEETAKPRRNKNLVLKASGATGVIDVGHGRKKLVIKGQKVIRRKNRTYPLECEASGVQPHQAGELRQEFRKHGLSVAVSKEGNPIYEDAGQRRKALACRGFHDRNSYHGGPS